MNTHYKKHTATLPKNRLIIGRKPLLEAIAAGKQIEKIFLLQSAGGDEVNTIKKEARERNIAISAVPQEKLARFTQANHQGVVAITSLIAYQALQDIIDITVDAGHTPLFVLLDGITDTRNVGAIARSAHCYGAHALIVPASNNASITDEAVKTSAGALELLPVCRVPSVEQAIDILHLNGITTYATGLQATSDLQEADLAMPAAIIMGSEDKGVSNFVLKSAQHLVRIPMTDNFDSLNVSVATGIILYETFRQRHT